MGFFFFCFCFLSPFISIEVSLIQDNTSDVAIERSFIVKLSIGPKAWEVPNWTNIPESVGVGVKKKRGAGMILSTFKDWP